MKEFLPAAPLDQLKPGEITSVRVGGQFLALCLVDGQPFCTDDICTHEGLAISSNGWVEGVEIECGWHGARFNARTGEVTSEPAEEPLRTYPVEVRDGCVYVSLG